MPNGTYGGVRGEETKVGQKKKTFVSRPTRLLNVSNLSFCQNLIFFIFGSKIEVVL